jgi:transcriptional regulator with XRE-family HTH domain
MDLSRFTDLLEKAFLEFRIRQTRQRLSVSLNSFAGFLDFSPPIVNQWLNGSRLPTQGNVERIIPKLVDLLELEVFDVLGLPRPDPDLQRLNQIWPRLSKEDRHALADQAERFATEKASLPVADQPPLPLKEPLTLVIQDPQDPLPVPAVSAGEVAASSDSGTPSTPA